MNFLTLIIQFLFYIFLSANKQISGEKNKTPKRTYPSDWTIPNILYFITTASVLSKEPIKEALKKIQANTCIIFNPMNDNNFSNNTEEFYFVNSSRCATTLGNINRIQLHDIEIGRMCNETSNVGKIQQLKGKALGIVDQHRRPDKDNYITVNYTGLMINNRIASDHYLEKWNSSMMHLYGIGYDYNSLFHWKNKVPRQPNDPTSTLNSNISEYNEMMGQTVEFNFADYKLLNYNFCNKSYKIMYCEMSNCINNGYCDINSDESGTCKCQNRFSGQLCDKLRNSDCTKSNNNIAESASKTLVESGIKNCTYSIKASDGNKVLVTI